MSCRLITVLVLAATLALMAPADASARVRLVSITSPISAGSNATLTVAVSPARACEIHVFLPSGRESEAKGLYPKRPSGGRVSWTWRVGSRTAPGRGTIRILCGAAGNLRVLFRVR